MAFYDTSSIKFDSFRPAYHAIQSLDIEKINALSSNEIRPILPSLVRMALCMPLDSSEEWLEKKKRILIKLSAIEISNSIVTLLSVDFHSLDMDVKKEMMVRSKIGLHTGSTNESNCLLVPPLMDGIALEFERADGMRKFRLVLNELLNIQFHSRNPLSRNSASLRSSELLDNEVYLEEVADVIAIAITELPSCLQLPEICETLLQVRYGSYLICRLVVNSPEIYCEVTSSLIANGDKMEEETILSRNRIRTLRLLCRMCPQKALSIREGAVEMCKMPGLAILITLDFEKSIGKSTSRNELVSFLNGCLLRNDDQIKTLFVHYLRGCQKKMDQNQCSTLVLLRRHLLRQLEETLNALKQVNPTESSLIEACSLVRLYCGLRVAANIKYNEEESSSLLELITEYPPATPSGVKLVSVCLCMLISCPTLISSNDNEKRIVAWLKGLIKDEKYFGHVSQIKSSFEEMLLLIAIHFHSGQISAISELISSVLGLKVVLRSPTVARAKAIFTQEIFADEMIAAHAVKVPVTCNLSAEYSGYLPVHCIYQLLKSRAFSKHKVSVKDWILHQVCECVPPLHPIMTSLIDAYVTSIIVSSSRNASGTTNEPISEDDLLAIFSHKIYSDMEETKSKNNCNFQPKCMLTSQLLLLHYFLLYNDQRLTCNSTYSVSSSSSSSSSVVVTAAAAAAAAAASSSHNDGELIKKYSPYLTSKIPIFFLVQEARRSQDKYSVIFPTLLRMIATHYPHLCLVNDWLHCRQTNNLLEKVSKETLESVGESLEQAFKLLPDTSSELCRLFTFILRLPYKSVWYLSSIFVSKLRLLLEYDLPDELLVNARQVWWRFNEIFPDDLWVMTVNSMRGVDEHTKYGRLTWNDIVIDPLYVLRCDERIFRVPFLLDITIHMLNAFLTASRTYFAHQLSEKASRSEDEKREREELRVALLSAQESAAIQILLESCQVRDASESAQQGCKLNEIHALVCRHLHQVFISDTNLTKLVHFQTYDRNLLPLTVSLIPSMHICLDFLPELLAQPNLSKQVFAIELCSHLSLHYCITKCLCVAKLCFNVSYTLLSVLSGKKRCTFFIPVLPAIVRMCRAFKPLREDALQLITQLHQISLSRLAATSCTFISSANFERTFQLTRKRFIDDEHFSRFVDSLPSDESLFMTVLESLEQLKQLQ